jgi:integrase/recombinase XerD
MRPADADEYFGRVMRAAAQNTRLKRAQALKIWFAFLELRHKPEIYQLTGYVAECPVDEVNRPRGGGRAALRIPPEAGQVDKLFAGWREELATCRKFAPAARNYAAARLMAEVGLRVNEARMLDLDDVRWDLGRFGKLHVRHGKGARGSGPRERMVPLINGAGRTLRWFIEDVRRLFGDDFARHGAPLLPSERHAGDGAAARAGAETLRAGLAAAAAVHLPEWDKALTPHVLRHFCASQLYLGGMDLLAIQEALAHYAGDFVKLIMLGDCLVEAGQQSVEDFLPPGLALGGGVVALLLEGWAELDGGLEERARLADGFEVAVQPHRAGAVAVAEHAPVHFGAKLAHLGALGAGGQALRGGPLRSWPRCAASS